MDHPSMDLIADSSSATPLPSSWRVEDDRKWIFNQIDILVENKFLTDFLIAFKIGVMTSPPGRGMNGT